MAKKKKKKMGLVYAFLVLLLLLAVYFGISMSGIGSSDAETEETQSAAVAIIEIDTDTISKISFTDNTGQKITLVKEEGIWYYGEDKDFPILQESVETLISNMAVVESYHELTEVDNLDDFGLTDPLQIVDVEDTNGNVTTLHIGNVNKSTGYYYIYLDDHTHLYTIASTIPAAFEIGLYDLVEAEAFPTIDSTGIEHVSISQNEDDKVDIYAYESDSATIYTIKKDGEEEQFADETSINALLTSLTEISFDSCVDYNAEDLSIYGLEEPVAAITIDYTETTEEETQEEDSTEETGDTETVTTKLQQTLYIGAVSVLEEENITEVETEEGTEQEAEEVTRYYYVKLEGLNQINLVSEGQLEEIFSMNFNDYLNTYISYISFSDLSSFEVIYGGKEYSMYVEVTEEVSTVEAEEETVDTSEETTEVTTYYVNGVEVDYTTLGTFYTNAANMTAESYTEEITELEGEPLFIFTFNLLDKSQWILRYYSYDASFYAVETEGLSRVALVNKLDVSEMITSFENLLELIK